MATRDQVRDALYEGIIAVVNESQHMGSTTRSRMILDAAQAYRAVQGGPQPGGPGVEASK